MLLIRSFQYPGATRWLANTSHLLRFADVLQNISWRFALSYVPLMHYIRRCNLLPLASCIQNGPEAFPA